MEPRLLSAQATRSRSDPPRTRTSAREQSTSPRTRGRAAEGTSDTLRAPRSVPRRAAVAVTAVQPIVPEGLAWLREERAAAGQTVEMFNTLACVPEQAKCEVFALLQENMQALMRAHSRQWDARKARTQQLRRATFLLLRDTSGMLIGFIAWRFLLESGVPVLFVDELQIAKGMQRRGIGSALLHAAELTARAGRYKGRALEGVVLQSYKANANANDMYDKNEFGKTPSSSTQNYTVYKKLWGAMARQVHRALDVEFEARDTFPKQEQANSAWYNRRSRSRSPSPTANKRQLHLPDLLTREREAEAIKLKAEMQQTHGDDGESILPKSSNVQSVYIAAAMAVCDNRFATEKEAAQAFSQAEKHSCTRLRTERVRAQVANIRRLQCARNHSDRACTARAQLARKFAFAVLFVGATAASAAAIGCTSAIGGSVTIAAVAAVAARRTIKKRCAPARSSHASSVGLQDESRHRRQRPILSEYAAMCDKNKWKKSDCVESGNLVGFDIQHRWLGLQWKPWLKVRKSAALAKHPCLLEDGDPGWGLYVAKEFGFARGDRVVAYLGKPVDATNHTSRYKYGKVDAADSPSGAQFANDAHGISGVSNNCAVRASNPFGVLEASDAIAQGDEILWPYGAAYHSAEKKKWRKR